MKTNLSDFLLLILGLNLILCFSPCLKLFYAMASVAKEKARTKKENAERHKRILSSHEKILKIKRSILAIVEAMLEKEISKEWFLKNCTKLCHADYDDVVQERSIEHLCGYPLCSNTVKQTLKQKYQISRITNKVYDITERKNYCCNQCYKASNYLKAQLSSIPLYMRKEEDIKIQLLSDCDNRGSAGEEIVFHHIIPKEEVEKVYAEEPATTNVKDILNQQIKMCADVLSDLQIKEHVFEKPFVFGQTVKQKVSLDNNSESDEINSDDSEDEKLFSNYDNLSVSSNRHMPIPETSKKTMWIPTPSKSYTRPRTPNSPTQLLSLELVSGVFKDWMTEDSMKYLLGEKYVYGIKADNLFEKMTASDPIAPEKLSSIKNEYINLCCKIDSLPDDDFSDSAEIDFIYGCGGTSTSKTEENVDTISAKKGFKKRPKIDSKDKGKKVTFASNVDVTVGKNVSNMDNSSIKNNSHVDISSDNRNTSTTGVSCEENNILNFDASSRKNSSNVEGRGIFLNDAEATSEVTTFETSLPEPGFPLIDSVSQNILRKQVLTTQLKSVYIDFLPLIGLHYTDIREGVKKFVDTLSLTPTNITFKPKEWKLISFILLRILTRTVLKDLHDEDKLLNVCDNPIMPIKVDLKEVEKLVHDIISPENVLIRPMLLH